MRSATAALVAVAFAAAVFELAPRRLPAWATSRPTRRGPTLRRRPSGIALALVTGVLYSNWIFETAVDGRADPRQGYVSELGARTQPHHLFFNVLSILAGLLILGVAARWRSAFVGLRSAGGLGCVALAIVGIGTIIDSLLPMDCAPSRSSACAVAENAWKISWQDWVHSAESVVTDLALLAALLLLAAGFARFRDRRWLAAVTAVVFVVLVVLLILQAAGVLRHVRIGHNERWSLALTSAWLECLVVARVPPPRHVDQPASDGHNFASMRPVPTQAVPSLVAELEQ